MPAPAVAAAPAPAPPPAATRAPTTESRWYGWQTLIADGASLTLLTAAGFARSGPTAGVAVAGYVLAAPIVHFAHGNVGRGFGSFGIRVGSPIVCTLIGAAAGSGKGNSDILDTGALGGAVIGFFVGMGAAIAIDASLLAREQVPVERAGALRITPIVAPSAHGGIVGAAAVF